MQIEYKDEETGKSVMFKGEPLREIKCKSGKWIEDGIPYECSCCDKKLYCCAMPGDKGISLPDICPGCGATMIGLIRNGKR